MGEQGVLAGGSRAFVSMGEKDAPASGEEGAIRKTSVYEPGQSRDVPVAPSFLLSFLPRSLLAPIPLC